jgi:hypothetical protein
VTVAGLLSILKISKVPVIYTANKELAHFEEKFAKNYADF